MIGATAVMAHGAKTAHQARFAAAAARALTAKTACGTDVMDPRSRITTVAEVTLAKFAGVMIVLNAGRTVFAYAAVKVAATCRAEIALQTLNSSFAPAAKIRSAKSVFRI